MTTLEEIRSWRAVKKIQEEQIEERKQLLAREKADSIISEDFYSFDNSICIKIIRKITTERAEELKKWLYENCREKFTYNSRWKKDDSDDWYLNFYFKSKKDAAQFKIFWG